MSVSMSLSKSFLSWLLISTAGEVDPLFSLPNKAFMMPGTHTLMYVKILFFLSLQQQCNRHVWELILRVGIMVIPKSLTQWLNFCPFHFKWFSPCVAKVSCKIMFVPHSHMAIAHWIMRTVLILWYKSPFFLSPLWWMCYVSFSLCYYKKRGVFLLCVYEWFSPVNSLEDVCSNIKWYLKSFCTN